MLPKNSFHWISLPFKVARLITPNRLGRFWYYLRANQTAIILDRLKRLLELRFNSRMLPKLYSPPDKNDPLVFPSCEAPLVSIVIPVYNQWETTLACLVSILENTPDIPYEVIIADDDSQDDTRRLAELAPGVHHITNTENLGFLRNCNQAARQASGKYLVLLNNDTHVQPNWLAHLVYLVEQDEHVGIAGPMLLYPDGRLQEAGGIIWQDGSGWNYGHLDYPGRPEYNYLKEVDYISGACILVRKSLWDEIGGFDDRFAPAYYEDTDLAFEVRRRGYKVVYQPLSRVVHLEGISHGKEVSSGVKAYQKVNHSKFHTKWIDVLDSQHGRDPRDLFTARDRSKCRKTVLYIDHYVPLYDQDAGSKTTFHYLKLLVEMGYRLIFLGDNFVDYRPYTTTLQQMGIEVLYGSWYYRNWKSWLSVHGKNIDYICLSRPHIAHKYLPLVKRFTRAKLLFFGHDLHYLREKRHYAVEGKTAYFRAALKWERWEAEILRSVDVSYYFSDFEVGEVGARFPGVIVRTLPTFLLDDGELDIEIPRYSDRQNLLFVGGFMHTPNVDAVCWFVTKVFPEVQRNLPGVLFTIIGSNPPNEVCQLAGNGVIVTGRVSDDELLEHYRRCRLVVAPLRFGAGVKAKIVEAMRHGIPTITTSVGAEGICNAEESLLIADNVPAFTEAIVQAYTDQILWDEKSILARQAMRCHVSKSIAREVFIRDMPLHDMESR